VTKDNRIRNQIFAAGFFSNNVFEEVIHLEDDKFNNDEVKFIRTLQNSKFSGHNYWLVSC
jgi:hypothetical protein